MKIIVDCNNDRVEIEGQAKWSVKYPNQFVSILEEILNTLNVSGVTLTKIDEDREYTIGEW